MKMEFKYSSKKEKKQKTKKLEFRYSDENNCLELILKIILALITSLPVLYKIVVKIVELKTNGLFYYFYNNRIFIYNEVSYEFGWNYRRTI